jgi:hypothetical protein
MVMMTVEMGAMRKAAMVSVTLQHRWEFLFKGINQTGERLFIRCKFSYAPACSASV